MCVFVLDKRNNPLMPCSERRARVLLDRGRAGVHRHHPFTIRLRDRVETVRFDTQAMDTPEISGVEYQQGTLAGYEVREYLLEKWGRAGLAKTHANEAVRVGPTGRVAGAVGPTLLITCAGRGTRLRTMANAHGHRPRTKSVQAFRTGDLVRAVTPSGVNAGIWTGRVAVRSTGRFLLTATGWGGDGEPAQRKLGANAARHCVRVAPGDGYGYAQEVQP